MLQSGSESWSKRRRRNEVRQASFRRCAPRSQTALGSTIRALFASRAEAMMARSISPASRAAAGVICTELTAWTLTRLYLGDYYRTYSMTVEDEVRTTLALPEHFIRGPISIIRDSPNNLTAGFTVRDGNYLSARWPGDAHRFSSEFATILDSGTKEQK